MARKGHGGNPNAAQNLTDEDRAKGGRVAHERGTAHEFTSEEAAEAGSKGGRARADQDEE